MEEDILKNKSFKLFYEISTIVSSSMDVTDILNKVLQTLSADAGVERSTITILNETKDALFIIAAHNLSKEEQKKGYYQLGEGITGKVAQSGKAMIIPKIHEEPLFLNKTQTRNDKTDISFICVPIKIADEVIGTFSVDRIYNKNIALEKDLELLTVITSLIAEKIKLSKKVQAETTKLKEENSQLKKELKEQYSFTNIVGKSNSIQNVFEQIKQVSESNATVLIRGESGTGKELVAHAIHYNSLRADKPFIKVNCSALPEDLIESELFGHEKGAFTDAYQRKIGRFELAKGGTIFLDEIGELKPKLQIKLLRVLQEREFERIGGTQTISANVRIITATNRNLEQALKEGTIREDFYYRINVFSIFIPPLRERKSDILLLADYFIEIFAKENNKTINRISTPAIDMIMSYHWPGNVRELENCIERAVLLSTDGVIHSQHLPPSLQKADTTIPVLLDEKLSLEESVNNYEKELIIEALKRTNGNKFQAAILLKTSNRIINYKISNLNIPVENYKTTNSN